MSGALQTATSAPPAPTAHQLPGFRSITVPVVDIDWDYFLDRRRAVLEHTDIPAYLLMPEIEQLLATIDHPLHHFLFNTLWHTGARVSEALALTPAHFALDERYPYVSVPRSKQRGRPSKKKQLKPRMLDLQDRWYQQEAAAGLAAHRGGRRARIFPITRQTVDRWLRGYVQAYNARATAAGGRPLSIPVSVHTFRHSFAVNAILHWVPVPVLQAWMGHARRESTEVYTQVLTAETSHLMSRVQFHRLPGLDNEHGGYE